MDSKYKKEHFIALRPDFVLDTDGKKPFLYPMDFIESKFFLLSPGQAFILSLFDGKKTTNEVLSQFAEIFPKASPSFVVDTLDIVDSLVKSSPTNNGIGSEGAFIEATSPILDAYSYDTKKFVLSNKVFNEESTNIKTRRRLGKPINIMAVPTHRCQTNCMYCYAERAHCQEMSLQRWQELFIEMTNIGIHLVSFDNGDTIARKDGIDILESALEHELHFLFSTKSLVTKDQVKRLMNAGLMNPVRHILKRKIQLSVDAIDDDVVGQIYGSKVYKDNITATFENFMEQGVNSKIKGVMMPKNAHQVEKIVNYFYERGAREFQFVRYFRSFFRHKDEMFLNDTTTNEIIQQIQQCRDKYPDAKISGAEEIQTQANAFIDRASKNALWSRRSGCGGGWSMLGISADGRAFLCEQMALRDEFCVGNLMQQSIEEIWNSERMFAFIHPRQEKFVGTICENCDEFINCHWEKGYCYRDAYFSYGTNFEAPPLCPKQTKPGLRLT